MHKEATEILDKMFTAMPDTVIPMRHELQFQFAYMYYTAKEKEKAVNIMNRLVNRYDIPLDERLKYASYYTQLFTDSADVGVEAIQNLLVENPTYANAVYWLANYYQRDKQYAKGMEVLDSWMNRNPSDKNAVALKNQLQQLMNKAVPDSVTSDSTTIDSVSN